MLTGYLLFDVIGLEKGEANTYTSEAHLHQLGGWVSNLRQGLLIPFLLYLFCHLGK